MYDVVIVGGGPSGLSAALALGRARKRVLVCDAGPRRNATATHLHNFITRDGTPPDDFRRAARADLATYPNVLVRDVGVTAITGTRGAFDVRLPDESVTARRILLCTGMIDERLPIDGFDRLWGRSIFQCPYCHGWEVRDRRWGFLVVPAAASHLLPFALQARAWTRDVTVYTHGVVEVPDDARAQLATAGVSLVTTPITHLAGADHLEAIHLADGTALPCDALFAHPPQRQVPLVRSLGLTLDADGYVTTDPMRRETSTPGLYASGDLSTRMQGALLAAAAGTHAAAMLNVELTMELALAGTL